MVSPILVSTKKITDRLYDQLAKGTQTPNKKYKILHIATEVSPLSHVGGISMVVSQLSKTMIQNGHDIKVFMPKFGFIDEVKFDLETVYKGLRVPTGHSSNNKAHPTHLVCNVKKAILDSGVEVFFLENMEYYEKRSNVYDYSDDHVRWALLSYGALKFLKKLKEWKPEILHVHDWHTSLIPNIIKMNHKKDSYFDDISTVLTIHNMFFQGQEVDYSSELNYDDGRSEIPPMFSNRLRKLNYLRRGILYADVVSTVSEGYAREITTDEYGAGLGQLLLELKSKLFGIVNGLDYEKLDPSTDPLLEVNYNVESIDLRIKNKLQLQKEFDLEVDKDVLLFGHVGRLDYQKGIDLTLEVVDKFLRDFDAQFVMIGGGNETYVKQALKLVDKYPGKVGVYQFPNFTLPKLVFSGSDAMLFPSRFEPCGIVQMEAMRYGSIPIARAVGGLDDTIDDFNPNDLTGNGFKFKEFDGWSLYGQMVRAIETYRNKSAWRQLQINAMNTDNSWQKVTSEYERLYRVSKDFKQNRPTGVGLGGIFTS